MKRGETIQLLNTKNKCKTVQSELLGKMIWYSGIIAP
jgi:hypothetical protein